MDGGWIDSLIQQLREKGHQIRRGYPVGKIPYLTEPAIAVCVDKLTANGMTLRLDIYCPLNLGGAECEDTAIAVVNTLAQGEGTVSAGECRFDVDLGLFTQSITVEFAEEEASK